MHVNIFSSFPHRKDLEACSALKGVKTTLLESRFARAIIFLSHNLHGIVRPTTCFVPKIMLTQGEIRGAQWFQMGA
jgi:hypothetical protein